MDLEEEVDLIYYNIYISILVSQMLFLSNVEHFITDVAFAVMF